MADLQRVDMGIAMCHFDLTSVMAGTRGGWEFSGEAPEGMPSWEYVSTWSPTR
jgi:hypothetical protein